MAFRRLKRLQDKGLVNPPSWLEQNVQYACIMGSVAYGCSSDTSDMDVYGFTIPPKNLIFPHLSGEIMGFGTAGPRFEQWQEHHVLDKEASQEYDLTIYSIVKFFDLCMDNNPNMLSALNVPQRCVLECTKIGQMMRDERDQFLHKGSYHKFRGYAYSQISKIKNGSNSSNPKRKASIEEFGFDVKFAYHVVRLALEAEQILVEQHLDVDKNGEVFKSIRRGEWSLEKIIDWFNEKEKHLEELYAKSTLRHSPDEDFIKNLLINCLEEHYGNLENAVAKNDNFERIMLDLSKLVRKYGG